LREVPRQRGPHPQIQPARKATEDVPRQLPWSRFGLR
jgi:hypothetical protein